MNQYMLWVHKGRLQYQLKLFPQTLAKEATGTDTGVHATLVYNVSKSNSLLFSDDDSQTEVYVAVI